MATAPWQLFAATAVSGAGWAMTGTAAINAMVTPWFIRRRPAALSLAYNGASVGGILLSPLWVALIAALGFPGAAAAVGGAMALTLWALAGRFFAAGPAALGQVPDGEAALPGPPVPVQRETRGIGLWRNRLFLSLALATSLSLFAQIGLIAHLFSVMAAPLGAQWAGAAAGLATVCAVTGRTVLGWLLRPGADRRLVSALNTGVQVAGSLVLLWGASRAEGGSVAWLLLGIVLFGLGLGNATSLPPLIAQVDFAPGVTARAVALVTACSQAAYAFAPAAFGLLRGWEPVSIFLAAALVQAASAAVLLEGRRADRGPVPP